MSILNELEDLLNHEEKHRRQHDIKHTLSDISIMRIHGDHEHPSRSITDAVKSHNHTRNIVGAKTKSSVKASPKNINRSRGKRSLKKGV